MDYTLPLVSILALVIPMPLLIVFSTISLIRQSVAEKKNKELLETHGNVSPLMEKRGA